MYSYYLATLFGYKLPLIKPWITRLQLIQFAAGLCYSAVFSWYKFNGFGCTGSWVTMFFSNAVNISFMVLFTQFYRKAYSSKSKRGKKE